LDARRNRFVRQLASITIYTQATDAGGASGNLGENEFAIVTGEHRYIVTDDIITSVGPVEFSATAGNRERNFTGISLIALLDYFDIDYSGTTTVRLVTADGLDHTWTAEEAFNAGKGFIAYLEDGEPLGDRDKPFRAVLVGAPANRWMGQLQVIVLN